MSAKIVKIGKKVKGVVDSVRHPPYMRVTIPAQMAKPAPPLGPQLGKRNINIANFCKEFNEKTKNIQEGMMIPCNIKLNPDRSYILETETPPIWHLLCLAAGCKQGSSHSSKEIAGMITLKHVYEIAKVKQQDSTCKAVSLESICKRVISYAHTIGIRVLSNEELKQDPNLYNPESYKHFLLERDNFLKSKKTELVEKKQTKMLRV